MRKMFAALMILFALLPACATTGDTRDASSNWRYMQVDNQNWDPVILYAVVNGNRQGRLTRVEGKTNERIRLRRSYLEAGTLRFSVDVCSTIKHRRECHRTQEYAGLSRVPKLVVAPTTRLYASLYGEE